VVNRTKIVLQKAKYGAKIAMISIKNVNMATNTPNNIGGGVSVQDESQPKVAEDVRITMAIPGELTEIIDRLRKPTKTSRRTWLLQAAYEKLKRDGEI
jgi:hypothetical protein